jgi:hypothetical protein
MASQITPAQQALIPQYVATYTAQGFYTSDSTRDDDEFIVRAVERAYKNAVRRKRHDSIVQVPTVIVGSMRHIVHIMRQTIKGDPAEVTNTIQSSRHNGQFQSNTDARFRFHLEVLGVGGDALEWNEVSDLYRKNGGMFMHPNVCYCLRPPVEFVDDENGNPVPVWNDSVAPTVYTPQNPLAIEEVTKYFVEDIEDLPMEGVTVIPGITEL